jgi:hypothetical protein
MSVHKPSYRILALIDRLMILSRGRTVYYGPPAALRRFLSVFMGEPIPDGANPAELALDHIRELEGSQGGTEELVKFNRLWQEKTLSSRAVDGPWLSLKETIRLSIARGKLVSGTEVAAAVLETEVATYANPWWVEVWVLTRRGFTNTMRTPELFQIRFGAVVVTAIILATIFWRLDNTPKGVNERFSFFAIAMSTMFYTSADALPVFLIERYIFLRETAHNAYRRSSYTLSNAIVAFPPLAFLSVALRGNHLLRRGAGRRRRGLRFLRPHRARLLLGGERVRHVPVRRGAACDHRLHRGGGRASLLPAGYGSTTCHYSSTPTRR